MIEENDLSRLKQITNEHSGLFVLGSECREERILENLIIDVYLSSEKNKFILDVKNIDDLVLISKEEKDVKDSILIFDCCELNIRRFRYWGEFGAWCREYNNTCIFKVSVIRYITGSGWGDGIELSTDRQLILNCDFYGLVSDKKFNILKNRF